MSKQRIPTTFPTDTELLDALQASTVKGDFWVCRPSAARGLVVHLTTVESAARLERRAYPTVRKALAVGLGLIDKET